MLSINCEKNTCIIMKLHFHTRKWNQSFLGVRRVITSVYRSSNYLALFKHMRCIFNGESYQSPSNNYIEDIRFWTCQVCEKYKRWLLFVIVESLQRMLEMTITTMLFITCERVRE